MSRSRKQFLLVSLAAVFFLLICGSGVRAEEQPQPTHVNFGYYDEENEVGTTVQIPCFVIPNYGEVYADQTCTWTSSDERVATVSQYGYVTGISAGTVTITATAINGVSASTDITFYEEKQDEDKDQDKNVQDKNDQDDQDTNAGVTGIPIYRLYLPSTGEHLYTSSKNEYDTLYKKYNWGQEGIAWYAPETGTAVYRLYHPGLKNHLYTTDTNEVNTLTREYGWKIDNDGDPLYYSGGDVPIYRVYNKGLNGMHHLTTDLNEYKTLTKYGWAQEGQKLSAVKLGEPFETSKFYRK